MNRSRINNLNRDTFDTLVFLQKCVKSQKKSAPALLYFYSLTVCVSLCHWKLMCDDVMGRHVRDFFCDFFSFACLTDCDWHWHWHSSSVVCLGLKSYNPTGLWLIFLLQRLSQTHSLLIAFFCRKIEIEEGNRALSWIENNWSRSNIFYTWINPLKYSPLHLCMFGNSEAVKWVAA